MQNEFKALPPLIALLCLLACLETETACGLKEDLRGYDDEIYTQERARMVEKQIKARGVKDARVIEAMLSVPRHLFVPERQRIHSYEDRPLPIGSGQTISQPYIVAFMTELLELDEDDTVLEVGTGSGYQAAVLAEIVKKVFTIEIKERLGLLAKERLKSMGYANIDVHIGDGYNGLPDEAPFNAIIVTAAAAHIPEPLIKQLRPGGRMVIPVGRPYGHQSLVIVTKKEDGEIRKEITLPVLFVPLLRER
ncbi:MAG: protein-L-isoaspartate(D-aspartate) O-methyltransferase [Candidatus Brocadiales bacterium]